MIRRFEFRQSLVGSYELDTARGGEHPLTIEIRAERARLLPPLSGRLAVAGTIDARGLAERRPLSGEVGAARWSFGFELYELAFEAEDGRALRVRARRRSATRLLGEILAGSERIARVELRLDVRAAVERWLRWS